jgi:hypothetical protein
MSLTPTGYGSFTFSPKYSAVIDEDAPLSGRGSVLSVQRTNNWPVYAGKLLEGITLPVNIFWKAGSGGSFEELKAAMLLTEAAAKPLTLTDGSRDWFYEAAVLGFEDLGPGYVTALFYVAEPILQAASVTSASKTVASASDTLGVSSAGTIPTRPLLMITANAAKAVAGVYQNKIAAIIYNKLAEKLTRYPLDVVSAGLNTVALVSGGFLQASGVDLRVFVDGVESPRYLGAMNTAGTRVWVNLDFQPGQSAKLGATMGAGDTIGSLQLKKEAASKTFLNKIPTAGAVLIDAELFTYTGKDTKAYTLTGVARAQRLTSAAGHSLGAATWWVEHDISLVYGNASAYAGDTYDNQDARMPTFNLSSSSNGSWVYSEFADAAKQRSGAWISQVNKKKSAATFCSSADPSADADAINDPVIYPGLYMRTSKKGAKWQPEDAELEWRLNNPVGITGIAASGKKNFLHDWPKMKLKRAAGGGWKDAYSEAAGSPNSWQAWSMSTSFASTDTIRWLMDGSIPGKDSFSYWGMGAATVTIDASKVPVILVINPGAIANNYPLSAVITNQASGEQLWINWPGKVGETLTIDCVNKLAWSASMPNASMCVSTPDIRQHWMQILPGANTLAYYDPDTVNVTFGVQFRDRQA